MPQKFFDNDSKFYHLEANAIAAELNKQVEFQFTLLREGLYTPIPVNKKFCSATYELFLNFIYFLKYF